jgi:hypothetical protein
VQRATRLRSTILAFAPLVERYLAAMEEAAEVSTTLSRARARLRQLTGAPLSHAARSLLLFQMEERGEEPPPVAFPDVWPAVQRAQKSVTRDLAVQLCRRALERLVVATQPPRTAAKLLKGASSLRS